MSQRSYTPKAPDRHSQARSGTRTTTTPKPKLQGELVPFSSSLWISVLAHVLCSVHVCSLFSEYLLCAKSYPGACCWLFNSGITS